jgi:hypothetical protein
MLGIPDCSFSFVNRSIDMTDGPIAQPAGGSIVFLTCNVSVNLVQQVRRAMQPRTTVTRSVDRRVIVEALAVVYGCKLDIVDRSVDLADGHSLVSVDRSVAGPMFYQPAGGAQIA